MSVETMFFVFVIGLLVALTLPALLKRKKETPMTASEMQGYEQERGRLKAQQEWNQPTKTQRPYKYGEQPLNKLFGLR